MECADPASEKVAIHTVRCRLTRERAFSAADRWRNCSAVRLGLHSFDLPCLTYQDPYSSKDMMATTIESGAVIEKARKETVTLWRFCTEKSKITATNDAMSIV